MEYEQQQPTFEGQTSYASNNFGYNTDSILRIRLDTQQVIQQIEYFLKGKITRVTFDEQQQPIEKEIKIGTELANEQGIQAILSFATSVINPQVVQGNYEWDTWREEISWCREQLAKDVFVNHDDWGIDPKNINLICNTVMNSIKPFLTRLVNNEERKSYSNFEHREITPSTSTKKAWFSL